MATWPLTRGQVVQADIGLDEPKLFVVVSNNRRNRVLDDALGVRLTTSPKPPIPSVVEVPDGESVHGKVCCDDITVLYEADILKVIGAMSPRTMAMVAEGLSAALDLN